MPDTLLPSERTRPSATVLLVRHVPHLEVFLAKRSKNTRFFPGYHVFPGGVIDKEDGLGEAARRQAALRELFEESGVLVVDGPVPSTFPRVEARRAAARGERIDQMLSEYGLSWAPDRLVSAGRILTPPFSSVRYDTSFFVCTLPEGEAPVVDGSELVRGAWWRPEDALARWDENALPLPPPTLAYLRLLAESKDALKAAEQAHATDGAPHHRRFRIEFHPGIDVLPIRTVTLPPATTQNCYLVRGDTLLIVDPGTSRMDQRTVLFDTLDDIVPRHERAVVVLTHHHHDHVSSAAAVKARYGARVIAHAETARRLQPGLVDELVEDEHVFDLGRWKSRAWRVRVMHTPGHAPGHIALVDERWGAVLAGDLVSGVSTILVDPTEGDMAQYMRALERCHAEAPPIVLPGHGPALPGDAFLDVLEHRRMRERKVLAALEAEPQPLDALLPIVYADTPNVSHALATRSLESHLLKLSQEGRAVCEEEGWRLVEPRDSRMPPG